MKIFMFFLLFFASPPLFAQATFKVMTYNVENFFDTRDNPTKNDDEFLPSGNRYWTQSRYYHKLQQIAKVISAAGEWSTPALIALCEVGERLRPVSSYPSHTAPLAGLPIYYHSKPRSQRY